MSAVPEVPLALSEAEYIAFERANEIKHEYLDGHVYAMTGASRVHNLICTNLVAALHSQLRPTSCEIYQSDMRTKVEATGLYTYPDVSVVCGEPQFSDEALDTLLNPVLVIEVLSPTTERYDRGKKFQHYRQLDSLQVYVLVSQEGPHIECFLRQEGHGWILTDVTGLDAKLELALIDCTLPLADVYEKVVFEPESDTRSS
jgi:Uma2 family endonuclease